MNDDKEKKTQVQETQNPFGKKVTWGCYVALAFAILFFSGTFNNVEGFKWLSAMDFSTISGKFGTMTNATKDTFLGEGGYSARAGFLFALSLVPTVMLALGVLEILEHYGAIRAAHKLMTPLLKPLLSLPGLTGLAMITDLQSTDAGAALTRGLADEGAITTKELTIMSAWQYSGAGMINNYVSIGSALFGALTVPIILPLGLVFVMKFFGGIICRLALSTIYKGDFKDEQ